MSQCVLEPYVLVRKADNTTASTDIPEEGSSDTRFSLRSRWYRSVVNRVGAVCWVHPEKEATIQCILCLRCKADIRKSYHCSKECLGEHWTFHRDFHQITKAHGTPATAVLAGSWPMTVHAVLVLGL